MTTISSSPTHFHKRSTASISIDDNLTVAFLSRYDDGSWFLSVLLSHGDAKDGCWMLLSTAMMEMAKGMDETAMRMPIGLGAENCSKTLHRRIAGERIEVT